MSQRREVGCLARCEWAMPVASRVVKDNRRSRWVIWQTDTSGQWGLSGENREKEDRADVVRLRNMRALCSNGVQVRYAAVDRSRKKK